MLAAVGLKTAVLWAAPNNPACATAAAIYQLGVLIIIV